MLLVVQVSYIMNTPNAQPINVLTLTGSQGNFWKRGMVTLPTTGTSFTILVKGIRGVSYTGDIALDDFSFGACPTSRKFRKEAVDLGCSG